MEDNPFLAWERRDSRKIERLQDLLTSEEGPSSIDCVVRIERHLGLERNSPAAPRESGRYVERDDVRTAYDHYRLELIVDGNPYELDNPLLFAALHVDYPKGGHYIGLDGKMHQDPVSLTLRPEDPDLVQFYSSSQTSAALRILRNLTGITPRLWFVREQSPEHTYEIPDVNNYMAETERQEEKLGYNKADPHSVKYAFPGHKLQPYSETKGFCVENDPALAELMALGRAA